MKLLRITAEGLPLFKEKLDLIFYAQQRVAEEQKNILYPLFSNIYLNSQAVAIRSGYMPLWTDTFGTRDIC